MRRFKNATAGCCHHEMRRVDAVTTKCDGRMRHYEMRHVDAASSGLVRTITRLRVLAGVLFRKPVSGLPC